MKAQITAISLDDKDRVVDMTVLLSSDHNTPLQTVQKAIKIDEFSETLVLDILKELLDDTILFYEPMPYTQAQIEHMILHLTVVKPGGPNV